MQQQKDDEENIIVSFNPGDPGHCQVKELLTHCKLLQYLDKFLNEGFDSLKSFCEVSEDDMIVMKVKRGHRRLIQREIATLRGIPRHEPLYIHQTGTVTTIPSIPMLSQTTTNTTTSSSDCSSGTNGNTSRQDASASSGNNSGNITSATTQSGEVTSQLHQQTSTVATTPSSVSSQQDITNKKHYHHHHHYHHRSSIRTIGDLPSSKGSGDSSNDDSGTRAQTTGALNSDCQQCLLPPKRRYRRHPKPDRNAPVKPPSAYVMFSNDLRNELKDQNLTFAQLAKIAGERWKALSVEGKNRYESTAVEAKNAYIVSLSQYRQTPEFKRYQEYLNDFRVKYGSHRAFGGDRKRFKAASGSPGSGSLADSSSNGNSSNSHGSSSCSGSSGGSADGNSYESGNGSNNDTTTLSTGQQQEQRQGEKIAGTTTADDEDDSAVVRGFFIQNMEKDEEENDDENDNISNINNNDAWPEYNDDSIASYTRLYDSPLGTTTRLESEMMTIDLAETTQDDIVDGQNSHIQ